MRKSGRESVKPGGTAGSIYILSQQFCRDRIFVFWRYADVYFIPPMAWPCLDLTRPSTNHRKKKGKRK